MPRPKYCYLAGGFAFISHPHIPGVWLRLDPCVVKVPCPRCEAVVGDPCKYRGEVMAASTHWQRREAAQDQPVMVKTTGITLLIDELDGRDFRLTDEQREAKLAALRANRMGEHDEHD